MIGTLEIKNFKSIKELKLDCKRINILIGEPNTGKSNILETLGLFSWTNIWPPISLTDFVRFEKVSDLFSDGSPDERIEIGADDLTLGITFKNGAFLGKFWQKERQLYWELWGNYDDLTNRGGGSPGELPPVKFYRFAPQRSFPNQESDFLLPPHGGNLMAMLLRHKEIRATAQHLLSPFGLRLGLRPQEGKIEVIKEVEPVIVSYPYYLVSDTLQRLVFYLTAILSNKESILVFEEPEAHAFPFYTKHLAETIALDDRKNQFFMSTHNPYLLLPLLEKSPKEDVAIFITYFRDYQTKVKPLSESEIQEMLDLEIDVFANLDRFLEGL